MGRRVDRRAAMRMGAGWVALGGLALAADVARAEERWVQSHMPTELWSAPGPGAERFGPVRQFSYFRVHGEQVGDRLYVYNPRSQNFAYIDARAVGPSAPPPDAYLARPRILETREVPARAVGTASVWHESVRDDAVWSHDVPHNGALAVNAAVEGEDGERWYRLADGTYVPEEQVRVPPRVEPRRGRWIDVDLNRPTIVTAHEDGRAAYSALAITGIGGWETPPGSYVLLRRVANERMRGPGWDVSNVLFTQYFTNAGHAIHYNYWNSSWGYPGSRGCLGMNYADSLWFWEWAAIGTPIVIHW